MEAASSAVAAGIDLGSHSRALRDIYEATLAGQRSAQRPRAVVARSWRRTLGHGLKAGQSNDRHGLDHQALEFFRESTHLRIAHAEMQGMLEIAADAAPYIAVVTDASGVILWRTGSPSVKRTADSLGFVEGAEWTERTVGTNAIGTALAEAAPVELFAAEHFEQQQHPWFCSAAPVHDPRTGDLIGIVDISGPAMTLHPALRALVLSSARLAEASLWRWHQEGLAVLRRATEHLTGPGPLLVVDNDGWVAHRVGVAAGERIAVPREGIALAVPGIGIGFPEPFHGGWLVKPAGKAHRIVARLSGLVLDTEVGQSKWTLVLTPRHAEILRLLGLNSATGTTASQLSVALFGDRAHEVTVRAEISRLRRIVGALIVTNPYRMSPEVNFSATSNR